MLDGQEIGRRTDLADTPTAGMVIESGVRAYRVLSTRLADDDVVLIEVALA